MKISSPNNVLASLKQISRVILHFKQPKTSPVHIKLIFIIILVDKTAKFGASYAGEKRD